MTSIIGQSRLLSKIEKYYTTKYLPKTLMFLGPTGCGKHTIAKYTADKFGLDFVEVADNVSAQELDDYLYSTINTLYVIDLNKFSEKQQNQFLKFIEEPSRSVYVLLLASSEAGILNTILNRCIKYHFEPYTKEQIEQITNTSVNDLTFKIFQTPGKLLNLTESSFKDLLRVSDEVIRNIDKMSYGNTLAVSTKINYKDLYNKLDFDLFLDTIEFLALTEYKNTGAAQSFTIFKITNQFKQYATQSNLIKETLMLNYLTTLWEAVRQ